MDDAKGEFALPVLYRLAQTTANWSKLVARLHSVEKKNVQSITLAVELHSHEPRSCLLFVVDPGHGVAQLAMNGAASAIAQAHVVVCEPGDRLSIDSGDHGEATLWEFRFDLSWERHEHSAPAAEPPSARHPYQVLPLMEYRILRLCTAIEEFWRGDALEQFRCQSLFQEMFYELLQQARQVSRQDPRSAILETKSYMERHYREKLTIEQLADMTGVSQGYFMQLFKSIFGCSPMEFIGDRRLDEARSLLRRAPSMPLREVAKATGFEDEGYFGRRFRQRIGLSPVAYRKNAAFKVVALNYHTIGHLLALQLIPSAARLDPRYVKEYYDRYRSEVALRLDNLPDDDSERRLLIEHRPDLIVVRDNTDSAILEELKQLAPVVTLPWNSSVQWRDLFRMTASSLRKEEQAERWLQQYERQAGQVRKGIPRAFYHETLLVLAAMEQGMFIVGNRHVGAVLFEDLGLTPAVTPPSPLHRLEPEMLASIAADRILLICDSDAAARQTLHEWMLHPAWREHPAVRNGNLLSVGRGLWFEYTPHAHSWSLNAAAALFG